VAFRSDYRNWAGCLKRHIEGNKITVTGLDALDKSPILDIKPYEEHFDSPKGLEAEKNPDYRPSEG
jgi:tRNA (Thr-GGU) A37 N-methylase